MTEPQKDTVEDITNKSGAFDIVAPLEPVEPAPADAKYVTYKGRAATRRITAEQWEKAGVSDQQEVVWDSSNNFQVRVDKLSDEALNALRRDGSFSVPAES